MVKKKSGQLNIGKVVGSVTKHAAKQLKKVMKKGTDRDLEKKAKNLLTMLQDGKIDKDTDSNPTLLQRLLTDFLPLQDRYQANSKAHPKWQLIIEQFKEMMKPLSLNRDEIIAKLKATDPEVNKMNQLFNDNNLTPDGVNGCILRYQPTIDKVIAANKGKGFASDYDKFLVAELYERVKKYVNTPDSKPVIMGLGSKEMSEVSAEGKFHNARVNYQLMNRNPSDFSFLENVGNLCIAIGEQEDALYKKNQPDPEVLADKPPSPI